MQCLIYNYYNNYVIIVTLFGHNKKNYNVKNNSIIVLLIYIIYACDNYNTLLIYV